MYKVQLTLLSLLFSIISLVAIGEELTVESYVLIDLETRRTTVDGMQARLSILQQGADLDEQLFLDNVTRHEIESVFGRYDTTGTEYTRYGKERESEIDALIESRPDLQMRYRNLERRFNDLIRQFQQLQGQEPGRNENNG
jgi:hypothetical protein